MIDRDSLDLAGLEAVGWLDDDEATAFAHERRVNPELRRASAEMHDLIAAIAATAPPAPLPPDALARIYGRLAPPMTAALPVTRVHRTASLIRSRLPWAVAASLALLAAWQGWRSHQTSTRWAQLHAAETLRARTIMETAEAMVGAGGSANRPDPAGLPDGERRAPRDGRLHERLAFTPTGRPKMRLHQDRPNERAEEAERRAAAEANQQLFPGITDVRIIEMRPPGAATDPAKDQLLSSRMAEAIASGLTPAEPPAAEPGPATPPRGSIEVEGQGAEPGRDILVTTEGMVNVQSFNLDDDAQLRHRRFPQPEDYEKNGLIPVADGLVYDGHQGLWRRSADGSEWIGTRAPDSFIPPEPGTRYEGPLPDLPPLSPPSSPDVLAAKLAGDIEASADVSGPSAYPVLDQQGRGSLIVQNLPPAPNGAFYHLWMTTADSGEATPLGVLPSMEAATDIFEFDTQRPGLMPSGYLLTLENAARASTPGSRVVLRSLVPSNR
jgi:hypothetical protein